jgi:hypothetical protein
MSKQKKYIPPLNDKLKAVSAPKRSLPLIVKETNLVLAFNIYRQPFAHLITAASGRGQGLTRTYRTSGTRFCTR